MRTENVKILRKKNDKKLLSYCLWYKINNNKIK